MVTSDLTDVLLRLLSKKYIMTMTEALERQNVFDEWNNHHCNNSVEGEEVAWHTLKIGNRN